MRITLLLVSVLFLGSQSASAAVLANRTSADIRVRIWPRRDDFADVIVKAKDVLPLAYDRPLRIAFHDSSRPQQYTIEPRAAYFFGRPETGDIVFRRIGISGADLVAGAPSEEIVAATADGAPRPVAATLLAPPKPLVIDVNVLVDEEEPATQRSWESRLKRRIGLVSGLLERHCFVRLNIVGFDTWNSDNRVSDFSRSVREFEKEVSPGAARLAIGFTSQYQLPRGKYSLGGTRGALSSHMLLREWSRHVSEEERVEVLLHEVGHFLGATHSPESDSVMRPQLGDRQARARDFRIGFDPLNTLALCTVASEMRRRPIRSLADISPESKALLSAIYGELGKSLPEDPAAAEFSRLLGPRLPARMQAPGILRPSSAPR